MNNEIIGKYYMLAFLGDTYYVKVLSEVDDVHSHSSNCRATLIRISDNTKHDVCVSTFGFEHSDFIRCHYTEISHEEFMEAYDKAISIINEYREQL